MALGIVSDIGKVAEAVTAVSQQIKQRDAEKNAQDVKAAEMLKQLQKQIDAIRQHIAEGSLEEIRKDES